MLSVSAFMHKVQVKSFVLLFTMPFVETRNRERPPGNLSGDVGLRRLGDLPQK